MSRLNFYGRRQIFTDERSVTDANVLDVLKSAVGVHEQNRQDIELLYGYYKGRQDILDRVKEVRPEICNKLVENHAAEIVNFKTGFTFGEPVQYVYRGENPLGEDEGGTMPQGDSPKRGTDAAQQRLSHCDDNGIAYLNRIMDETNKASKDSDLAQWFYICGIAHRLAMVENGVLNTYVCDPRNTFVVYSNDYRREPVLACTYSDTSKGRVYSVWSDTRFWVIKDLREITETKEFAGGIPIFEYRLAPTRQGSFETVLPLIDAMNNIASNRMDGIEQIIQSFIWFNNCEVDDEQFKALREKGGICTKSTNGLPANIQLLQTTLDQQQSQTFVDYMYEIMLTIAAVPDRKASAGGNTGQALVIGQGWTMAESAAKSMEHEFKATEKRFLAFVLRCLNAPQLRSLTLGDIEIKFTRNKTDNLLTKTQGLQNQLEAGIHPRIAIAHCGLYSDPEQVFLDSSEYLQKWLTTGEQDKQAANVVDMDSELEAILNKLGGDDNGELSER